MNITLASATGIGFLCSYFLQLTMENVEQYLAVAAILLLDGFFGVIAGTKREGFKTYKALRKGFIGTGWLSETIIAPFIIFQLISALKNASMAGFIKNELLNIILDKIDKHKGIRGK